MIRRIAGLAILLSLFAIASQADIAPDPGFTRVTVYLVVELKEDIPGYRFFIASSNLVKEVQIKKGERTNVGPLGGGARYSSGTLFAIPSKSLKPSEVPEDEYTAEKIPGAIKLIDHGFQSTVRTADAGKVKDAMYRIEAGPTGPKAVEITDDSKKNNNTNNNRSGNDLGGAKTNSVGIDPRRDMNLAGWTTIAFGTLMSLAIVAFGLWAFFRVSRRRNQ